MSKLEEQLALALTGEGFSFCREYHFHPTRRWRFDFALPDQKIAIEVEGGLFIRGRHARGAGIEKDIEKYNSATLLGWKVIRVTNKMIKSGEALGIIKQMYAENSRK